MTQQGWVNEDVNVDSHFSRCSLIWAGNVQEEEIKYCNRMHVDLIKYLNIFPIYVELI